MQVLSKVEQPTSPSSSNSIITPKSIKDLMQTITKLLEGGQESAHQLKTILNDKRLGFKVEDDDHDHHSWVTLNAFETCLSMLRSYDFDHQEENNIINKRKVDRVNDVRCSDDDHSSKSDGISDVKVFKEKRGCYKRRRIGQSQTVEATSLMDDGYTWRKYGQKVILNSKYPRNYFRCTHKYDQYCQATKQVQQISENPIKYNIIYHGQHTCKNLHKTSSSFVIDNSPIENSSFFLSFDTNKYSTPKHALNSSFFPPSNSLNSTTTMVNHDHDHHCGARKQYSSSSSSSSSSDHYPPSSSDLTSTGLSSTPVSYDQSDVISQPEIYSSTSTPYDMDEDFWLSLINMEQDYLPRLDGSF